MRVCEWASYPQVRTPNRKHATTIRVIKASTHPCHCRCMSHTRPCISTIFYFLRKFHFASVSSSSIGLSKFVETPSQNEGFTCIISSPEHGGQRDGECLCWAQGMFKVKDEITIGSLPIYKDHFIVKAELEILGGSCINTSFEVHAEAA